MEKRKFIVSVKTKNYCAGVIANSKRVIVVTVPILKWAMYKKLDWLKSYLERKGILEEWEEGLE